MSNPIKQVSTTDVPGQYSDETQPGYKQLPPAVKDSTYFDARVPANIIDRIRRDARERQYGNSTLEAEAIRATDEQVFEKVRAAEQHSIQRADAMLNQGKGRVGDALSYLDPDRRPARTAQGRRGHPDHRQGVRRPGAPGSVPRSVRAAQHGDGGGGHRSRPRGPCGTRPAALLSDAAGIRPRRRTRPHPMK